MTEQTTRSDDELDRIAGELIGTLGWNFHKDHPDLNEADMRRIYESADSCNTCGYYWDPCEFDRDGNCEDCAEMEGDGED